MNQIIYFEDFKVDGPWHELGCFSTSTADMIEFASLYDPQPMHLDEEAGKASMLGGLASSGWQTGALLIKQMVEQLLINTKNYGSPGVKEAHWLAPVFPDDRLSVRYQVKSKRVSNSKPHMGIIDFFIEAQNQAGEPVMTMVSTQFIGLRGAS
jgi:acyl dehydratase